MNAMRYLSPLMLSLGMVFILNACYPGDPVSTSDLDIVATTFSEGIDFGTYKTFWVTDSIHYLYDSTSTPPERTYEAQILSKIKSEMMSKGYVYKENPSDTDRPDLAIDVTAFSSEYRGYWYYPGYPWYPGWGGGWWNPWYPGYYPPVGGSYSYTTGTVVMHMIDVSQIDPADERLPVIWQGAINGLTSKGSSAQISARIDFALGQAFTQSPYLGAR